MRATSVVKILVRAAAVSVALGLTSARSSEPAALDGVEKAANEWIKTRMETARLTTEWSTQRPLLESIVNGFADRAQTLEEKRDFLTASTAKERDELTGYEATTKEAAADLQAVAARAKTMSDRLIALRRSLPPRLSSALEMSYRSLANPDLSVGERMQINLIIVNRCTQFNRTVSCEDEVLAVGGQNPQLLEVIYWGLAQGYALDRTNAKVWHGTPGAQGWQWKPLPDAAPQLSKLIAIYHDKADPDFVTVPARVSHATTEQPVK